MGIDWMLIELITNTIFMVRQCKKEEFDYYIRRFEKCSLLSAWGCCMVGFEENRNAGVVSWDCAVNIHECFKSCVRVNGTFSDNFLVPVGLHQNSVLSPFLFTVVWEAI